MSFSPFHLSLTILTTVLGLSAAYLLRVPLAIGFAGGLGVLVVITLRQGVPVRILVQSMVTGMLHTKEVMYILLLVGLLIPAWTASGTIPFLIDTGLKLLNPAYFVSFSFVFAAGISMILGTSTGTLSAVGIPLVGMGALLHIPLPLVAGALVSGAFVGDRTSPFSSANQLVAASTGMTVPSQFRFLLPTTLLAFATALTFFVVADVNGNWKNAASLGHASNDSLLPVEYASQFHYSLWLWLPVAVLFGTILLRFKTRYGFLLSIGISIVLGTLIQGVDAHQWLHGLWYGYASEQLPSLHSKGVSSMIGLIILIALAGAYNGILEETSAMQPYMSRLFGNTSSQRSATVRTSLFGLALALLACTQTLPIMMTGRNLLPLWEQKFPRGHLSRVVADAPLIFSAMVPWNLLAILCGTILGVPVERYAVFAVFLWTLPLYTWIVSYVVDINAAETI
ncbi:Na+/H+ antiporter NhaC family protein [Paenibacillus roseipurpureus]|uniref:Na+/H+ antiporter NhaC family protein n=1 Tax=Paenibacillus roseopurpureus TaxID=2918901 RepID=A0AA96RMB4_9BACL|nr:Na+/H+ antiporter NhaC family protein [Paenibacillus sp. MBLB1832]WNR44032.1 Na+/H+ antiporter NhaC family protein [Paenibacillus sp. MBLB1832]